MKEPEEDPVSKFTKILKAPQETKGFNMVSVKVNFVSNILMKFLKIAATVKLHSMELVASFSKTPNEFFMIKLYSVNVTKNYTHILTYSPYDLKLCVVNDGCDIFHS